MILWILLGAVLAFFLYWRVWFLRRPRRTIPKNGVVSPANGKLMKIIPFHDETAVVPKGMLGEVNVLTKDVAKEGYILVIRLTPLDVHYQRAPVSGAVANVKYRKGTFKNVVSTNAAYGAFENEKNEILLDGTFPMKVVQVAGIACRRIRCDVKKDDVVKKGDVIGLINFGSQVLVILPKKQLQVQEGDYLVDGETVLV
ncbi:MAG: phosphatidylserine decarboxylase [Candidatus Woesearchaeota archaeon]|nr:phosphatidylserine decarboxylase [Candidatus Woesearchaeota archaeon]